VTESLLKFQKKIFLNLEKY